MQRFIAVVSGDSMWPTYTDGQRLVCTSDLQQLVVGSVVVFIHPLRSHLRAIKRIKDIDEKSLFVEGDHPDPLASEDSHNFGWVKKASIIAIKHG